MQVADLDPTNDSLMATADRHRLVARIQTTLDDLVACASGTMA
ncbi:hypothetical protein AB0E59_06550 [Lentzea sp. NPDC034063]